MTVQHADIFHCLCCGRMHYEPHGSVAPDCCNQPMVRAVADVVKDVPHEEFTEGDEHSDLEQHAFLAELVELSTWCHRLEVVDESRVQELVQRLTLLRRALTEQFDDPAQFAGGRQPAEREGLRKESQRFLASLDQLRDDLSGAKRPAPSWADVCQRIDSLLADFRQHAERETALTQRATRDKGDRRH